MIWRPDTCKCSLECQSTRPDNLEAYQGFCPHHEAVEWLIVNQCDIHVNLGLQKDTHYDTVLKENRLKNRAVNLIEKETGVKAQDVEFSFDEGRSLKIKASREATKEKIEKALENDHEKDKIQVEDGEVLNHSGLESLKR